jgi:crotonobetainyl-CoA:carnitine CoA-transferase CaiB-like acyl-CoA transferase
MASLLWLSLISHDLLLCRYGYFYFVAIDVHQWKWAFEIMGNPEWAEADIFRDFPSRSANWDALRPLLEDWMQDKSVQEVYHAAQAKRVPFAPVSTMGDLLASNHLNSRGFFASIAHPEAGTFQYPGAPYRFSATPWALRRPAPCLGQHNEDVYGGRLGITRTELEALKAGGVI